MNRIAVKMTINGKQYVKDIEPRILLSDFIRDVIGLTGTHIGCEHGVCGACSILVDGEPVRSCLMLAVQADGCEVETVESLASEDGSLHFLQQAFAENHALQCGFCTPGFLMSLKGFIAEHPDPSEDEIREAISGNLCRCTGYSNIVKGVKEACAVNSK